MYFDPKLFTAYCNERKTRQLPKICILKLNDIQVFFYFHMWFSFQLSPKRLLCYWFVVLLSP